MWIFRKPENAIHDDLTVEMKREKMNMHYKKVVL